MSPEQASEELLRIYAISKHLEGVEGMTHTRLLESTAEQLVNLLI
jgi:hypothetical protein